jgi:DNA excision repair protein ERCC-6
MLSPSEFFEFFFNENLCNHIVQQSVIYAVQKNREDFSLSVEELKTFLGILILSGYVPLPRKRMYWEERPDSNNQAVSEAMRRRRFEEIMRNLHLNDNNHLDQNDRLSKIRPFLDHLRDAFIEHAPWEKNVSMDEAMVPYYGRHGLKQYIKGKPIRFGYKVWCMNLRLGYLINFEVYQGSKGPENQYKSDFGVGGAVLLNFSDSLPRDDTGPQPFHVFADNYFLSLKVVDEFTKRGTGLTGTIRSDRIGDCPLKSTSILGKEKRGAVDFRTSENSLVICCWNDNSVVSVISNCEGVEPLTVVTRYSAAERKRIKISEPRLIGSYNDHMGGTDRMDQNVAKYRINIRSKKWWWPLFLWGIDVALQNAWLLYRNMQQRYVTEDPDDFLEFRRSVALTFLQKYGTKRSRIGRVKTPVHSRVPDNVRYDSKEHILKTEDRRIRCAVCKSQTTKRCKKCSVALHEKCFEFFHRK